MNKLIRWLKDLLYQMRLNRKRQEDYNKWEKNVKRADQLSPKDQAIYYEEEQEKWKAWYGED